ncbi:MAG TPA: hypothetical protein VH542_04660 [Steroidobacteraceae bacterium]
MIQPLQPKPASPRAPALAKPKLEEYLSTYRKPREVKVSARETHGCVEWFDYGKHPLEPQEQESSDAG